MVRVSDASTYTERSESGSVLDWSIIDMGLVARNGDAVSRARSEESGRRSREESSAERGRLWAVGMALEIRVELRFT
jgi:hypothetical protein